ncbi:MAG TPA: hypothetical protein H9841_08905 [Candidatus Flavonifractor merdigallinarum]|uniref:Uncharacterized protein n=1 Tax=Candidatus Flavonifractor merdigallinarum TaxID=2838589 RepID=A0A9D1YAD8_9FIRM|nr:hypothetical protein [Candidatus Flavonifractor merdigallinarum]
MKNWNLRLNFWFLLSVFWIVLAFYQVYQKGSGIVIGYNAFVAALFAVLGIAQNVFEKQGQEGKKKMNQISLLAIAAVVLISTVLMALFL